QSGNAATRADAVTFTPSSTSTGTNKAFKTTGGITATSFTIPAGATTISFLYFDERAGTFSITTTNNASSPTLTNPSALSFTVSAGTASKLAFTSSTTSSTAGANSAAITVTMQDQFGNTAIRADDF